MADTIITCERTRDGAPSKYGAHGFEVVRDGWSCAIFRARREWQTKGGLTPPTPDALADAKADAILFAGARDLLAAANAIVDRDCQYDGPNVVIPCTDHAEAIRLFAELRAAVAKAEGAA